VRACARAHTMYSNKKAGASSRATDKYALGALAGRARECTYVNALNTRWLGGIWRRGNTPS